MLATICAALAIGATPAEQKGFDIVSIGYDVTLTPDTGETTGLVSIEVKVATTETDSLVLRYDAGLEMLDARVRGAPQRVVTIDPEDDDPLDVTRLVLDEGVTVGETIIFDVILSGQLSCGVVDLQGHRKCKYGPGFGYLRRESVLPIVVDPTAGPDYELYRRTLRVSVPAGVEAIASGDFVRESTAQGMTTREWASDQVHDVQDLVVVVGDLVSVDLTNEPPMKLWYVFGDDDWITQMTAWTQAAMPCHQTMAGSELPFAQVDLVKLPNDPGFAGTATSNMVLLSEGYANLGEGAFEETLSHELSHLWYGNVAFPDERGYWLFEGLARHAELEYMAERYPTEEAGFAPGDWSGRSRWHANVMRYVLQSDAPLVLGGIASPPNEIHDFNAWAYARGAATLEHLKVMIGAAAFSAGLQRWVSDCAFVRCTSEDFQQFMEAASGEDLAAFFAQHVYGTTFPDIALSFTQARTASGVEVTVDFTQSPAVDTTMELWLVHGDGTIDPHLVDTSGAHATTKLTADEPIVRVTPNPYHDPILWVRSAVDGDVDLDGAVDGVDIATCAQWVAIGFEPVSTDATLFDVNPMDFRCDLDADGAVTKADLDLIVARFGTLEAPITEAP